MEEKLGETHQCSSTAYVYSRRRSRERKRAFSKFRR